LSQDAPNGGGGTTNNRTSTNLEQIRRVIVLGDSKVGKTSIVRRVVDDIFNKDYDNTINYDIVSSEGVSF
jgi:GTPase SAR1 family protein